MRALVIEDEADLARLLEISLRDAGFAVDVIEDGKEGLQQALQYHFDIVVLDMLLPGMNGQLVLEKLRNKKPTPIIVITAIDDVTDRVAALNAGADDYLVKPFSLTEFVARVNSLIRRSVNHPRPVLKLGGVSIDTLTRKVSRGDQEIALTPKEYELLELLAMNRGKTVARSTIYENLFHEDDTNLANLIDVHMSNVRKKLGTTLIRTVRGYGYIIDDN